MMRIRLISLVSAVVMLLTLVVGCAGTGTANPSGGKDDAVQKKAQLTVAMNPIFVYDDGEAVIAYNDIKNAMQADYESAGLTAMYNATRWQWAFRETEGWALRATYALSRWKNGAGATVKNTHAYAFDGDGLISVMPYSTNSTEVVAYDDGAVPQNGLLLSAGGKEQEGLLYTAPKDGRLNVAAGAVTAVEAVGGVNTGFLAEDGTPRRAAVSITVNSRILWSGTLCNTTAGDGTAVTSLNYPQLSDIPVVAGDLVIISVQLDAEANRVEDITAPDDTPNNSTVSGDDSNVDVDLTPDTSTGETDTKPLPDEAIPLIEGYDARFVLVRAADADADVTRVAASMRERMEALLDAEVLLRNENAQSADYEIVLGKVEGRPESVKLYNAIVQARANNADDYIIRRVGTKVYIVATNAVALQKAVDRFMAVYCADDDSEIPASVNEVYRSKKNTLMVGNANIASFIIRIQRCPSYWETTSAELLQSFLMEETGYVLPVAKGGTPSAHDIQVGPQNNGVMALWNSDETRFTGVQDSGYLAGAYGGYAITVADGHLSVNGGSSHAVNAGVQALTKLLDKQSTLPMGYTASGTYEDDYTLSEGYGLTWAEEFDYNEGSDAANEKAIKRRWTISGDTTAGPTLLAPDVWDEQRRPGIYGENYWVKDGLLWEVTKWAPYGYDAVRLTTMNKMYFAFGVMEVRMVAGTRNGACSSVWMSGEGLNQVMMPEFDVYENFGFDGFWHAALTWTDESHGGNRSHFGWGQSNVPNVLPEDGMHFYDSFHYVGIKWTPSSLSYYVDGRCTYSHDISDSEYDALRNGQIIKLANGVGTERYAHGRGAKEPYEWLDDVTQFYETQLVDCVRIYQLDRKDYILRTR